MKRYNETYERHTTKEIFIIIPLGFPFYILPKTSGRINE